MAEDKKAADVAMELAEDARESTWEYRSFTAEMFKGKFGWDLMHPFPAQSEEDKKIGDDLLEKVKEVLETYIDPYETDRSGEYNREALDKMAEIGLFGMKIPKEYGGLGLSVQNYARVLGMIGSYCGSTVTYLSAHQSIGVPEPGEDDHVGGTVRRRHLLDAQRRQVVVHERYGPEYHAYRGHGPYAGQDI